MIGKHAAKTAWGEVIEIASEQIEAELAVFELGDGSDRRHQRERRPQRHGPPRQQKMRQAEEENDCRKAKMPCRRPALEPGDQRQDDQETRHAEPLPGIHGCQPLHISPGRRLSGFSVLGKVAA
ncbi:hypothetical protein RFN29_27870 [Mesorhizobium sp. VK22B]|uniref:Uncharacterized protein n=1 Tax=Mesorhizobium captivum TaxID=3072319 RepID=A0ABU4ZBP5_9HYPH|nr:hypothetical protein [Mesorhizobium sp. VK22B]MDX8495382.1 hypothetical protein [Mesorhizobium sp. VK22B]